MLRVFNNTARYVDQCVVPDTYIYTDKGPVKIETVVSNETQIINEKGEMEVIENVLEHSYDGSMITIKTMHSLEPLTITQEHPILVLSGQQRGLNYNTIKILRTLPHQLSYFFEKHPSLFLQFYL